MNETSFRPSFAPQRPTHATAGQRETPKPSQPRRYTRSCFLVASLFFRSAAVSIEREAPLQQRERRTRLSLLSSRDCHHHDGGIAVAEDSVAVADSHQSQEQQRRPGQPKKVATPCVVADAGGDRTLLAGATHHCRTDVGRFLDTTTPQRVSHCCFAETTARFIIRILFLVPMMARTPGSDLPPTALASNCSRRQE
jgi:hypothetical protein